MKKYLLVFVCFSLVIFSCSEKKANDLNSNKIKKIIGKVNTDSTAPPIVIPVNHPAIFISPVTTIKPYSLEEKLGREVITSITPENGLPLGSYKDIIQDDIGNLWAISNQNLVKYDGHSFHSYQPVIEDFAFVKLAIDKQQHIWTLGVHGNFFSDSLFISVFIFNGKSFQIVPDLSVKFSNKEGFTINFFQGPDKLIWVVNNYTNELCCYDGKKRIKTLTRKDFPFKLINHISFDQNKAIWFTDATDTSLTKYDGTHFTTFTKKDGLPKAIYEYSIPVSGDSIYISTDKGTFVYSGGKSINIHKTSFNGIVDKKGTYWSFVSGDSIIKQSSTGNVFFGMDAELSGSSFGRNFNLDQQENIWLATDNAIQFLYRPITAFRNVLPESETDKRPRTFFQDKTGNFWFGSYHTGINKYNGKSLTNYSFLDKPGKGYSTENNIVSIAEDSKSNIWMGTGKGSLIKFDGKQCSKYIDLGSANLQIEPYNLMVDSKDNIWFSNNKGYFNLSRGAGYFNGKEFICFTTAQGLSSNFVTHIFEDNKGVIWMGTGNGLNKYDGKKITVYTMNEGLPNNFIEDIIEDEFGHLWVCTDGGISRFDGEKFTNYTTEQGLQSNELISIKKSRERNLFWVNSEAGMTAMHLFNADSVSFVNLGKSDGFPVAKSYHVLADNQNVIWSSESNNTLKRFDYAKIKANSKPFNLHITDIRINNTEICWNGLLPKEKLDSITLRTEMQHQFGKGLKNSALNKLKEQFGNIRFDSIIPFDFIPYNLVLPISDNAVSFDFAAIDPHFSNYTSYQYKLEGFDKSWSPISKSNNANYGNLKEGNYFFRVKALNSYGIWSETSYSFKVLPPWYRTWWAYLMYTILIGISIYTFILWRTRSLQQEKIQLEEKVTKRTSELKDSLDSLQATQSQLIQSEKMASLGELTAGIAHEIQNPLNFVNNFAEVNAELIDELQQELNNGNTAEAITISNDIKENEQKISHHGKRADAIVKGMLQHSRSSNGQKEPTDINALCDEYLRLSYHGLRAKDKSFNANFETQFDDTVGMVNMQPQEMGRVILNLINNAFYAVNERKNNSPENYDPKVTVTTKKNGDQILVTVKDNGIGIPQKLVDKIFQPFFTTKPTGQGTGLGLSLSYDIVKAHGGELTVETKEGEGTTFQIRLTV